MKEGWKALYESTPVPPQLSSAVEEAAARGRAKRRARRRAVRSFSALAACAAFVLALNLSPTLASALYEVPVLGELCQIVTAQRYTQKAPTFTLDVRTPQVDVTALTGDVAWAEDINALIDQTIQASVDDSKQRAQEYFDAFVDTGGDPADFHPMEILVNYDVKYCTPQALSFTIEKFDVLASAYYEHYYYNLDPRTGLFFTLEDVLGPDYVSLAAQAVEAQLAAMPQEDQAMLFPGVDIPSLITPDRGFYLTEGAVTVVFEKYELGAGALGILEFSIPLP